MIEQAANANLIIVLENYFPSFYIKFENMEKNPTVVPSH